MLEQYPADIQAAIEDLQTRQTGEVTIRVRRDDDSLPVLSMSTGAELQKETLTQDCYRRLMKKCVEIQIIPDGTVVFFRRGFLRGYTGFYLSPDGLVKDVSDGGNWCASTWLTGNYFSFEFGY